MDTHSSHQPSRMRSSYPTCVFPRTCHSLQLSTVSLLKVHISKFYPLIHEHFNNPFTFLAFLVFGRSGSLRSPGTGRRNKGLSLVITTMGPLESLGDGCRTVGMWVLRSSSTILHQRSTRERRDRRVRIRLRRTTILSTS